MNKELGKDFSVKVLLVVHEKRIEVDTACSNLAIKYNLLYLSVYQLIRQEILAETELGRALVNSKRVKSIEFGPTPKNIDPYEEREYSAVHYDPALVMQLVKQKIAENRTSQRFILLEGFMNCEKLESMEDRMQSRVMDEFFSIVRNVGPIAGYIDLRSMRADTEFKAPLETFPEPVQEEEKKEEAKVEGAEGEEAPVEEEAAAAEE